ncbi:ORM1-like protein 1 [Tubulanus polymorphus]|uniref:ORM1-like protein 1 n=1 Tax=Tubulanus polymorphus TaxID=672921 RepID=UPI003DA23839
MQVGTDGGTNPTETYFNSKGMWVTYILIIFFFHLIILSIPFFTVATAWTLTNLLHNVLMFLYLHIEKGTPFETCDQGKNRVLTVWEQFDHGEQLTATKKFLTVVPIVLFFLASLYTKYDPYHFTLNASTLILLALVPKLPQLYKKRLFGINKY